MSTSHHIFLYGPPASGKTTTASMLGSTLNFEIIDTDALISQRTGKSIACIFAQHGEPEFRQLETEILKEIIADNANNDCVVSLGGGTLLDHNNRKICEENGSVICLDSPSEAELERRLSQNPKARPLGNKALERAEHYAPFSRRLTACHELNGSLILIGTNLADLFVNPAQTVFDENVARLYPQIAKSPLHIIASGEQHKTPQTIMNLWHSFAQHGIGRKNCICSCGGGVTGDLSGFAAATWMRGINWMNFPTTLLSMIDASVGGKTGCDLPEGKNLAGAFHSPKMVVIDTAFLNTLPERELQCGKAEMLKHQIISGKINSDYLSSCPTAHDIAENLLTKINIVREDPFETSGKRIMLNCGHTIGHAIETIMNYKIQHGEAVAIGCIEEGKLAVSLGLADKSWPEELARHFAQAGLPTELPDGISLEMLKPIMLNDKKHNGSAVDFALPCSWGNVVKVTVNL